jgi:hypothetical protein
MKMNNADRVLIGIIVIAVLYLFVNGFSHYLELREIDQAREQFCLDNNYSYIEFHCHNETKNEILFVTEVYTNKKVTGFILLKDLNHISEVFNETE